MFTHSYGNSVNAHAEELRSLFVAHEGKKRLVVKTVGDRYTVDYGRMAQTFTKLIHENVRHRSSPCRI